MLHYFVAKKFTYIDEQMIWVCSQDSEATIELSRQQQKGMIEVIQSNHEKHQLLHNFPPLTHNTVSEVSRHAPLVNSKKLSIWVISIALWISSPSEFIGVLLF